MPLPGLACFDRGMRLSGILGARSGVLACLSLAIGFLSSQALAQPSKDNTSPPIDVPTAPVPQGPMAPPPPPGAPKPPAPKPAAPKPAAASPAPKAGPAEPKADDSGGEPKQPTYNNEGVFKISGAKGPGVVGNGAKKPAAATGGGAPVAGTTAKSKSKAAPVSATNVAQWPGFHLTEDGGSEVIVEFSKATGAPSEHKAAGSYTYVFKGPVVSKANNKNPLITVHFNTPVASARLISGKGELRLVVEMRAGVEAAASSGMRAASEGGGGQQFFVKFPAGSWLPKGADSEEMPPPPAQKLKDKGKSKSDTTEPTPPAPAPKSEGGSKTGPNP